MEGVFLFQGILGAEICADNEKKAIFEDFNLDVCISKINSLTKGYDLQALYMNIPKEQVTVEYRREITGDFQQESVRNAFFEYSTLVEKAEKYERESRYNNHRPQEEKWHLDAMCLYVRAVEELFVSLSEHQGLSRAMQELVSYLTAYRSSESFVLAKELTDKLQAEMGEQPVTFSLQKNKVIMEEEAKEESFGRRMAQAFRISEVETGETSLVETHKLSLLERNLAERTVKLQGWGKPLQQLMKITMDETLLQLSKDVQYYLGFFRFVQDMQEKGYYFCMPEEGERMQIRSGYDLAMAVGSEEPVISNDFEIKEGERFFVITGANGGGKTTFARMIGQVLYFCRMGLLVPCHSAVIPQFERIISHFSNEESEISGRGKLVEELERLRPMMKEDNKNSFVILNELFTTAATLDAGIMGQKVLDYFMNIHCYGIYVTHIQSLAEEREGVVSMVAELEEDHHTRSFKIARKPAKEGEYEDSIITRYHMTYEGMKEVIGHGD